MSVYFIAELETTNAAGIEPYRAAVPATIAQYGGRFLTRGGATQLVEGGLSGGVQDGVDDEEIEDGQDGSGANPSPSRAQGATRGLGRASTRGTATIRAIAAMTATSAVRSLTQPDRPCRGSQNTRASRRWTRPQVNMSWASLGITVFWPGPS